MYELLKKAQNGNEEIMNLLTERNAGLVYSVASRFENRGCEAEDLRQIGMIGLIKAIRRFDTSYEVKFSTYAVPLIAGEIRRFLRDDGIIKVSRTYKELSSAAAAVSAQLSSELMREPTLTEIAQKMEVDLCTLTEAVTACSPCDSIYRTVSEESKGETLLLDTLKQDEETCRDDIIGLNCAIQKLDKRMREVIAYRYFMDETQTTVAKKLGISQVQVSRIEKKALSVLRGLLYNGETA